MRTRALSHLLLPFNDKPRWIVYLATFLMLLIIGFVDWITGPEITVAFFYLIPVALAAWFLGRIPGYIFAVFAAIAWLAAERLGAAVYTEPAHAYLNGAERLLFFFALVLLVSGLKTIGLRLENAVEQRTAALTAEIEVRHKAEAAMQKLAAQLSEAEASERRALAYDIHDALSQMLGLLKLNLEAAMVDTAAMPDQRLHSRLTDLVRMADTLIQQTRTLTFELHPAMLDDLGLVATLEWFAEDFFKRTTVEVLVKQAGEHPPMIGLPANYLFRSIKELVSNAVTHGKATEIVVSVHWLEQRVRIVVDDNGTGFDPAHVLDLPSRRGLGLAGIHERLTSLGGFIRIESEIGQGARAVVEVPIQSNGQPPPDRKQQ